MAKTQEELNALKEEVNVLNKKLSELSEEELNQVTGGMMPVIFASVAQGIIEPRVDYHMEQPNWNSGELPIDVGNYKIKIDIDAKEQWKPATGKTSIS